MNRSVKGWLIAAVVLVIFGGLTFSIAFAMLDFDISKINTQKYETNTYEPGKDFDSIDIDVSTAKVTLAVSDDESCKIECKEREHEKHSVSVKDDTLFVKKVNTGKWYHHIADFNFGSDAVTVYLPKASYDSLQITTSIGDVTIPGDYLFCDIKVTCDTGDIVCSAPASDRMAIQTDIGNIRLHAIKTDGAIQVKTNTGNISFIDVQCGSLAAENDLGNITLEGVVAEAAASDQTNAGDIQVEVNSGNVSFTEVQCRSLTATNDIGDVTLKGVLAEAEFSVQTNTGDIKLDGCDGGNIVFRTDVGNIRGTLLTDKVIFAESETGSVDVPKSTIGEKCEITTQTGDIKISISGSL